MILAPPSGRRPGADAPPAPLATPLHGQEGRLLPSYINNYGAELFLNIY